MSKKKTSASLQLQPVIMAVPFLIIGFALGKTIDTSGLMVNQPEVFREERAYLGEEISLPEPALTSRMSVEEAMQSRRSRRAYSDEALSLADVSQLLWSVQGQTADWGGRTVPSAKEAYPLNVTLVAKNVEGLNPGVYHYQSESHSLKQLMSEVPAAFDEAAVQSQNKSAPAAMIISGDYQAMTDAFDGKSNDQNVVLEVGHAGQNAYLQVESLGLGTVVSGGFNKDLMQEILSIPAQEDLFYMIPVGVPVEEEKAN